MDGVIVTGGTPSMDPFAPQRGTAVPPAMDAAHSDDRPMSSAGLVDHPMRQDLVDTGGTDCDIDLLQSMPPQSPLPFAAQSLAAGATAEMMTGAATDLEMGKRPMASSPRQWRALVFGLTLGGTAVLLGLLHGFFAKDGLTGLETALLGIIGVTFAWIILTVATIVAALLCRGLRPAGPTRNTTQGGPLTTALLIPVYNESPADVFGNAAAMLADLQRQRTDNRFALFILSDTRSAQIAEQEWRAFQWLRDAAPAQTPVFYRRRAENTDKKTGNLGQWIQSWGAAYEAMLVLDADSLMSGRAICVLAEALRKDPSAGLIQSFPGLIGAQTLYGRIQQFSNATYSWLLAEGLALWTRDEGNYWGHNAILRTRAFAASAGLPHLRGWRGRPQMILSHDFVEAGLLRRAGWAVRFLAVPGSFEETPATLVDYVLRDRRWCQGNLQHLRLLGTRGFHPLSRFHLLFGAVSYLMSPGWLVLLIVWATLGLTEMVPQHYFSETNPLYPLWPEMSTSQAMAFLLFMYGMLLLPKLAASVMIAAAPRLRRRYGGAGVFWGGVLVEVLASILYAPIMMVQQSLAVAQSLTGSAVAWAPQRRGAQAIPVGALLRFHAVETVLGVVLVTALSAGLVSPWLWPIAVSLVLAVPLSALSGVDVSNFALKVGRLETPHSLFAPAIWRRAQAARAELRTYLEEKRVIPAE